MGGRFVDNLVILQLRLRVVPAGRARSDAERVSRRYTTAHLVPMHRVSSAKEQLPRGGGRSVIYVGVADSVVVVKRRVKAAPVRRDCTTPEGEVSRASGWRSCHVPHQRRRGHTLKNLIEDLRSAANECRSTTSPPWRYGTVLDVVAMAAHGAGP